MSSHLPFPVTVITVVLIPCGLLVFYSVFFWAVLVPYYFPLASSLFCGIRGFLFSLNWLLAPHGRSPSYHLLGRLLSCLNPSGWPSEPICPHQLRCLAAFAFALPGSSSGCFVPPFLLSGAPSLCHFSGLVHAGHPNCPPPLVPRDPFWLALFPAVHLRHFFSFACPFFSGSLQLSFPSLVDPFLSPSFF